MSLLERVLLHEGFREKPYQDHLGIWTIGHGLTYLTSEESEVIVEGRLKDLEERLIFAHAWLIGRPPALTDILVEMCFQMGWAGCHKFENMWAGIQAQDYSKAAREMLDSRWAKQTPGRAEELADLMRRIA